MIYLCSDCGNEFEGDGGTSTCPNCGAGKDAFIMQPFSVISECEAFCNVSEEE
jgi:rubredoxin